MKLADPVEDGSKEDEALEGSECRLKAAGDTAMTLDSSEEILDAVAFSVMPLVEWSGGFGPSPLWNRRRAVLRSDIGSEASAVVGLVDDDDDLGHCRDEFRRGGDVVDVARGEHQAHWPAVEIDHGVELGVASAPTGSHSLGLSQFERRGAVLVDSDISPIKEAQFATGACGHPREKTLPHTHGAETTEGPVDRLPWAITRGQVAPRVTPTQNVKDRLEHDAPLRRRPPDSALLASTRRYPVNFFRPFQVLSDMPLWNLGFIPQHSRGVKMYKH